MVLASGGQRERGFLRHMIDRQSHTVRIYARESETARWNALKKESSISLIRRIAEDSDELALRVFHETRSLFYRNGKWLRTTDFIRSLRDRIKWSGEEEAQTINMSTVTDEAYDLTLAKFYNIPGRHGRLPTSDEINDSSNGFTWNVDCRLYFKRLLTKIEATVARKNADSEMVVEEITSSVATSFVLGQYYLSLKECKRRDSSSIRYVWTVKGKKLYLFYPPHLTAKQFRTWLEENISDVNTDFTDEQNRIQDLIDQYFYHIDNVFTENLEQIEHQGYLDQNRLERREGNQFSERLRVHVAREKSENLEKLRPSLKNLGKKRIYDLVHRIFTDLEEGEYNLSEVASNFGISKATLSRFAGSDWNENKDRNRQADIPELWANTAHVLAGNPVFMETVKNSGYTDAICGILKTISPHEG